MTLFNKTAYYYQRIYTKSVSLFNRPFIPNFSQISVGNSVIITYHKICKNNGFDKTTVSLENFVKHIEYLNKNYKISTIDDLLASNGEIALGKKIAVITFDDGYKSTINRVAEVVDGYGIPVVFYVNTNGLNKSTYLWPDLLEIALKEESKYSLLENLLNEYGMSKNLLAHLVDGEDISNWNYGSSKCDHHRHILARELRKRILTSRMGNGSAIHKIFKNEVLLNEDNQLLSKDDILKFAANPRIIFGGHTHSHVNLSLLSKSNQKAEILSNKKSIEKIICKPVTHFAYPYGGANYFNRSTIQLLKSLGFKTAVTTLRGFYNDVNDNFVLPRISAQNLEIPFNENLTR